MSVLFCPQLHFVQTAADMMIVKTKQRNYTDTLTHTEKHEKSTSEEVPVHGGNY